MADELGSPVRGGPGAGQGDPGKPADRAARGAAPVDPGGVRRSQGDAGHAGRGQRARPGAGQPGHRVLPGVPGRRGPGGRVREPGGSGVRHDLPGASPVRAVRHARSPCGICGGVRAHGPRRRRSGRPGAAGGGHRRRPACRQPAWAPGTQPRQHFLFSDDRFTPWSGEFERAAARDGVQPQRRRHRRARCGGGSSDGTEAGLRDEVADLVILAWAALRTRAWYERGGPVAGAPAGFAAARDGTAARAAAAASRLEKGGDPGRGPVRAARQLLPHRRGRRRADRGHPVAGRAGSWTAPAASCRRSRSPTSALASKSGIPGGSPPRGRAAALLTALRRAGGDRVRMIETLARTRTACYRDRPGELAHPGGATSPRAGARSAGTGSRRSARRKQDTTSAAGPPPARCARCGRRSRGRVRQPHQARADRHRGSALRVAYRSPPDAAETSRAARSRQQ